ncbi:MAG: hypothetical protein R2753_13080 [Chitinophagales bacterium]
MKKARQIEYFEHYQILISMRRVKEIFYATNLVDKFLKNDMSIEKLLSTNIHSSIYRLNHEKTVVTRSIEPRTRHLDDIPSPWLTGILDKYFGSVMAPLFETNRGCPFTCTFCVQGTK